MQKQKVSLVAALSALTVIYYPYWLVITKRQMIRLRADIPPSWLVVVPGANIYWFHKYCQGAQDVTRGQVDDKLLFGLQAAGWLSIMIITLVVYLYFQPWPGFITLILYLIHVVTTAPIVYILQTSYNQMSLSANSLGQSAQPQQPTQNTPQYQPQQPTQHHSQLA